MFSKVPRQTKVQTLESFAKGESVREVKCVTSHTKGSVEAATLSIGLGDLNKKPTLFANIS